MISAETAGAQLRDLNQKAVARIPERTRRLAEAQPVHIFNIGAKPWVVSLGGLGQYTIHACPEGQKYSPPTIIPAIVFEAIPTDMKTMEHRQWDGMEVAEDLLGQGPFKAKSNDLGRWGVFISRSATPSDDEIAAANQRLDETALELCREAEAFYQEGPNQYINITALHRWAAQRTNQQFEWSRPLRAMAKCPGCGESVNPEAAVHAGQHGCGAVINEAKVIAIKLKGYEHLWQNAAAKEPEKRARA